MTHSNSSYWTSIWLSSDLLLFSSKGWLLTDWVINEIDGDWKYGKIGWCGVINVRYVDNGVSPKF
jgi:hypothetical protein